MANEQQSLKLMIGSMVTYESNPGKDSREMGVHSVPKECPAVIVRQGKADGSYNLTVFVDNQGVSDSFHHGTGTISRLNVPHESVEDNTTGKWKFFNGNIVHDFESTDNPEDLSNVVMDTLVKRIKDMGFELAENFTEQNLQDMEAEYNSKLEQVKGYGVEYDNNTIPPTIEQLNELITKFNTVLGDFNSLGFKLPPNPTFDQLESFSIGYNEKLESARKYGLNIDDDNPPKIQDLVVYNLDADGKKTVLIAYGYELKNDVTVQQMDEMLNEFDQELASAKEIGFQALEEDDITIQMIRNFIQEYEDTLKEKELLLDKLTKTGHAEAGYLEGEKTVEELRELDHSYENLLAEAYAAGLKKKTAKNAKPYTLTQINEALGIKAG